jgi:hypothetical protein
MTHLCMSVCMSVCVSIGRLGSHAKSGSAPNLEETESIGSLHGGG